MKCPIFCIGQSVEDMDEEIINTKCLKEECAWWNKGVEMCDIGIISCAIDAISDTLEEIRDKMPHAGQFTK